MENMQWIVACVSAHTVAPHPNFSQRHVTPSQLLALLAEGRFADYERHVERVESSDNGEMLLVRAARDSLSAETQPDGAERLKRTAEQASVALPLRVAAGLFASVALSELDQIPESIAFLEELAGQASRADAPVAEAAVRQQLVLRLIEMGRLDDATDQANMVLDLGPTDPAEPFATSKAYRGGSTSALREARRTLVSHARAALATLESIGGKRWIEVVRSRPSHSDERASRAIGGAGTELANREFEAAISWSRGRRRFFTGGDPVESPVYGALLHAELSGDVGNTRVRRELLGRLRLLNTQEPGEWAAADAIRLLRQSDAREALEDAIQWLRAEGPLMSLANAASALLERSELRATECDLIVIVGASDLLNPAQLRAAIALCEEFRDSPSASRLSSRRLVGWAAADLFWRWIARLLPASDADELVAARLRTDLEDSNIDLGALAGGLIGTIQAIDWSRVSTAVADRLRQWAMGHEDPSVLDLRLAVLDQIDGVRRHSGATLRPAGLALAARLLSEHAAGCEIDRTELAAAGEACVADMSRTIENAARGVYSFGGFSAAELAVLLAVVLEGEHMWEPVLRLLRDRHVSSNDKAPVLARLARLQDDPSASVAAELADSADLLLSHQGMDPFEQSPMAVDPHGLRFLLAFQLLDSDRALRATSTLSGSRRAAERVEAARSVAVTPTQPAYSDWTSVIALQLSHDRDAVVRAEAGLALGAFLSTTRSEVVRSRLTELLEADGVLVPLLTLRGLIHSPRNDLLRSHIETLASGHPSRLVRPAAAQAWEDGSAR